MKKVDLPEKYKEICHIKEDDLERLNKHIERFEKERQQKKVIRRYVWFFMGLLFVSIIVFGLVDFNDLKNFVFGKTFLIKQNIRFGANEIEVRITRPSEKILSVVLVSSKSLGVTISNSFECKDVFLSDQPKVENMKYDNNIFILKGNEIILINVENLNVME